MDDAAEVRYREYARLYLSVVKVLDAYWNRVLSKQEIAMLCFITGRTLRWGKRREAIPYRHFLEGVWTQAGELVQKPLHIARRNIAPTVDLLEQRGLLCVHRVSKTGAGYLANVFEINFKTIIECDMNRLKPLKNGTLPLCPGDTTLVSGGHTPLCPGDTHKIHKNKRQKDKQQKEPDRLRDSASFSTAQEAIAAVTKRSQQRRADKAVLANMELRFDAIRAAWQQSLLQHYPKAPAIQMTKPQWNQFCNLYRLCLSNIRPTEFFDWVVLYWIAIRSGRLAWMNRKREVIPANPDFHFLAKYLKLFAKCYAEHEIEQQTNAPQRTVTADRMLEVENERLKKELERAQKENERLRTRSGPRPRPIPRRQTQTSELPDIQMSEEVLERAAEIYNSEEGTGEWHS